MKLDLGAGARSPNGFIPLGRGHDSEIFPLPYADGSAEIIRCSHALEHFPHRQIPEVLAEWVRVLKPGGTLMIAVPDFRAIAERYLAGERQPTEAYLMGGQVDENDFHRAAFDEPSLKSALAAAGLVMLRRWTSELGDDCAALPISLNVAGTKPRAAEPRVSAVMTTPRLGFNDMWNCAIQALPRLGIDVKNVSGAFWDQCLTLAIDQVLSEDAPDYILTIDYDSVFHAGHVSTLMQLAMVRPDVDAIAPLQASRHGALPLFGLAADDGEKEADGVHVMIDRGEFEVDLRKVPQAHFGLTLLKADRLKALAKPWFVGIPNASGEWKQGKVDPDISFWRSWERAGFSLCLAPRVVIGHLELMVRWPDDEMRPTWQPAQEWERTRRAPGTAWTGVPS